MSTLEVSPTEPLSANAGRSVVNDFSLQVATVNGSGSQTANTVLMRAMFQMGIPVSGKNMFPSNIAGLPPGSPSAPANTAISAGARRSISWWR